MRSSDGRLHRREPKLESRRRLGAADRDFSAAIVGADLDAERIEIWTDVDGMMTTDPNLCPDATPDQDH